MKESVVALQLRIREGTHRKLKSVAEAELRSLNSQIEYFLLKGLEEYERTNGPIRLGEDGE